MMLTANLNVTSLIMPEMPKPVTIKYSLSCTAASVTASAGFSAPPLVHFVTSCQCSGCGARLNKSTVSDESKTRTEGGGLFDEYIERMEEGWEGGNISINSIRIYYINPASRVVL